MVSIKTKDNTEKMKEMVKKDGRNAVDLICAIDVSGSMEGEKIELVKKTLKYLLSLLNGSDRLCLVSFNSMAKRLSNLMTVS